MIRHITVTLARHFRYAYKIPSPASAIMACAAVCRSSRDVKRRESRCIKQFGARLVATSNGPHKTLWTRAAVG
jgi:hypothetical protein